MATAFVWQILGAADANDELKADLQKTDKQVSDIEWT